MLRSIAFLTLAFFLASCGPNSSRTQADDNMSAEPLVVYTSNYPLSYFAQRIGKSLIDVKFPAAGKGDPAFWQPTTEEVLAMQDASLIFLNGATYEQWTKDVSLPPSRTVNTTANLTASLIEVEGAVTHSHGGEGEHSHAGTAFTTWLDLSLASEQAKAIYESLVKVLPDHQNELSERYETLKKDLLTIDETWRTFAAGDKHGVFFSHPVYQYLQEAYGIDGQSLHWEPGEVPDAKMLSDFRHDLGHHPAKWMIWEGKPDPETVKILEDLGVKSVVVSPCGDKPSEGDFMSVMAENTKSLMIVYGEEQ